MFPANPDRYAEVFGSGGQVLFDKPLDRKCMEVYSDYSSNLVNLFHCIKNRTVVSLQELRLFPLNSRDEFTVIRDFIDKQTFDTSFLREELQLAECSLLPLESEELKTILSEDTEVIDVKRIAAFFKLIRCSYESDRISHGCQPFDVRKRFAAAWQASYGFADTVIENRDSETLIRQYDREGVFFYYDPPYYETGEHYAVVFRREDHTRSRDVLAETKGKWMASYNDCEFIRELYVGYTIAAVTHINNLAQRYDGGYEFPEVIITNYDPGELE